MQNIEHINSDLDGFRVAKTISCDIEDAGKHVANGKRTFNLLSQNIRSVNCNMSNLTTLLQRSKVLWDVLVLSECWLPTAKCIPSLKNYNYASTTLHKTQNEGVIMYVNKNLNVNFEEPTLTDANCLVLKLNAETCIIGIYRPPNQGNTTGFINSLDQLLSKLNSYKNIFLCGDINIDITSGSSDRRSFEYLNILASHAMLAGHNIPTHGRTCLDHVMIKTKLKPICLIFNSSITDHQSVGLTCSLDSKLNYSSKATYSINFENLDITMQNINLQSIIECGDVNQATNMLTTCVTTAVKENSRIICTPRRQRISKPWISKGLLRCMKNRDNLFKKLKRDPDNETLKLTYKRYRNFCSSLLKKAKRTYERNEIEKSRGNKKQLWDVIKNISYTSNEVTDHSHCLLSSSDPQVDINKINSFFVNVGRKLATQITTLNLNTPPVNDSYSIPPVNSFVMLPADESDILNLIMGLKETCATGTDMTSSKIIKRYADIFIPPMTHICNLALSTGIFPNAFKTAVIKPIHKAGDKDCVDNYRPISILPALSKILERLINQKLTKYLETNKLISSSQFGFRGGISTKDAVHELVNAVITNLDDKRKCLVVFLDLAKAFDTVSIPHLVKKLERLGIRGVPLKLLEDYLSGRKQRVRIDSWLSDELPVEYGVPQGSILGPTLFLAYINDLCQLSLNKGKVFTYADDTALFFSDDSWEQVFNTAQSGFSIVSKWLQSNILTLNVNKTKYIAFAHRPNLLPDTSLNIIAHECNAQLSSCSCPNLLRTDKIKYLGITIDQSLTFKPHLEILVSRLRKLIYIFKTLRHTADRKTMKMIYYALCQSIIDYCITSWGGACKSHIIEVERAQRAILKVGAGLPFRFPSHDLYKEWDVLTVRQAFILHTVLMKHSQLQYDPNLIADKRRKDKVCLPERFRSSHAHKFFCYLGSHLYNKLNLPLNIYPLTRSSCKITVTTYLKKLNYLDTENLLTPPR